MLNNLCTPVEHILLPIPSRGCKCSEINLDSHMKFINPSGKFARYLLAVRYQPYVPFVVA